MKGNGKLNSYNCYKVVYDVVINELRDGKPGKGCEDFWIWAKRIPNPDSCKPEIASALCTSVSHCKDIGLQCFFQCLVKLSTITAICGVSFGKEEIEIFENAKEDHEDLIKLGYFIHNYFNGNLTLDESDYELLKTL